jgi:hypothetical protein
LKNIIPKFTPQLKKPIDALTSFQPEKRKINVVQGQTNKFLKGSNYTQMQRMHKLKIGTHVRIYKGLPKFNKKGKIIPNAKADFNWAKSVYKIVGTKKERNYERNYETNNNDGKIIDSIHTKKYKLDPPPTKILGIFGDLHIIR